jgi:hypothetical protein
VEAGITRTADRAPLASSPEDAENVIELVDASEAQQQRWVAVLLEDDGGGERCFEAVGLR